MNTSIRIQKLKELIGNYNATNSSQVKLKNRIAREISDLISYGDLVDLLEKNLPIPTGTNNISERNVNDGFQHSSAQLKTFDLGRWSFCKGSTMPNTTYDNTTILPGTPYIMHATVYHLSDPLVPTERISNANVFRAWQMDQNTREYEKTRGKC
jgi:hypothetical protein